MTKIRKNILSAMLLAILIISTRFISIKTNIFVISFSFIPIMMSAIWLGPKYSTGISMLGDLLGAILFPFGPYFPGFTISAGISGFIYGIFLYNKGNKMNKVNLIIRLILSSIIVLGFVNIFVTSFWINILYKKAYLAVVTSRIVLQVIMCPIQIIIIYILENFSRPFMEKYLLEEE